MRLSAKALVNFSDVNHFSQGNEWNIRSGEPNTLYFQLVDLDQANLRYISLADGVTMAVTFPSLDDASVITVAATQETADPSIWTVALTADQVPESGNVQFAITEGAVVRRFSVINLMAVEDPINDGSC